MPDVGQNRSYGFGSPLNNSALSSLDEDNVRYDCFFGMIMDTPISLKCMEILALAEQRIKTETRISMAPRRTR